jgi:hypothetical protein
MSGKPLWNLIGGLDMFGPYDLTQDKAERLNMFGLGAGHAREWLLELGSGVG